MSPAPTSTWQQYPAILPIIYVRGYAMTMAEKNETAADPFNGFNGGSTVYRASFDRRKSPRRQIFESPVVRLASDYGYEDVYRSGNDITDDDWPGPNGSKSISRASIIIHRYYDECASLLGGNETPDIKRFANRLSDLILRVRDLVVADGNNQLNSETFRCYLVAHSMGGLICRAFLQNTALGTPEAKRYVDKVFTYATPHNGIDMLGLNVPSFLTTFEVDTFNREKMRKYLGLNKLNVPDQHRVDWWPDSAPVPLEKFFCMVGTNRNDYEVAAGLSRAFSGHGSDGLVRIENATLCGVNSRGEEGGFSPRAFAYRSHSGPFGIVNSEEAYQNLVRFLFGDVRVDIWLDIHRIELPPKLSGNKKIEANYEFGIKASPRGMQGFLTRRVSEEDSVAARSHAELTGAAPDRKKI